MPPQAHPKTVANPEMALYLYGIEIGFRCVQSRSSRVRRSRTPA